MITAGQVAGIASETGFRIDVVEKVLRLQGILDRLDRHELTRGAWVLKGGTALNLLHLDVPRLSLDIDINYVGETDVAAMRQARPDFERALSACCEREGCAVRRAPVEHAGGKFRLRYASVLGGSQNLEVDVNYVARIPLWGTERMTLRYPPGVRQEVPTLVFEELAAGKFAALLQRSVVRDAYDAAALIGIAPDLTRRPRFRVPFVCFVGSSRGAALELSGDRIRLEERAVATELVPLLRQGQGGQEPDCAELAASIQETLRPALEQLLVWSDAERHFLDRLQTEGEIEPALLHDDPTVRYRIRDQPMLIWKAQHVREHRERR